MARRNRKGGNTAGLKGWSGFVSKPSSAPASHLRAIDDRASMQGAREKQYLEETGEEYQDSAEGTKLEHTPISEVAASGEGKKNIFNRLFGRDKEKMEVGSLAEQQKREEIALHGTKKGPEGGGRTKTYYDKEGNPIVFKSEEHRKQYEDNLAKIEERKQNVYGDSATITESGKVVKTPRTKDMDISTHYKAGAGAKTGVKGEPSEGDIKKGGYHGSKGWVSAEEAEGIRAARDTKLEKERIKQLEEENLRNLRDIEKTGVTPEMDLTFEGEQTNLKDPSKYADRPRQLVTDYETGVITEKVKRRGLRGLLGGYKPTGRVIEDKAYQEQLAEEQALAEEKKKNKKKKKKKPKLSKEEKQENKKKKQEAIDQAREAGADHYYLDGVRYTLKGPTGQRKF